MQVYKEIYLHISIEIYLQVCTAPSRNAACHDSSISCAVLHITMAPHRAADSCMSDSQAQRGRASVRSVLLFSSPLRVRARCYQPCARVCARARVLRTRVCKRERECVCLAQLRNRRGWRAVTVGGVPPPASRSRPRPRARPLLSHGRGHGRDHGWSRQRSGTVTATVMDGHGYGHGCDHGRARPRSWTHGHGHVQAGALLVPTRHARPFCCSAPTPQPLPYLLPDPQSPPFLLFPLNSGPSMERWLRQLPAFDQQRRCTWRGATTGRPPPPPPSLSTPPAAPGGPSRPSPPPSPAPAPPSCAEWGLRPSPSLARARARARARQRDGLGRRDGFRAGSPFSGPMTVCVGLRRHASRPHDSDRPGTGRASARVPGTHGGGPGRMASGPGRMAGWDPVGLRVRRCDCLCLCARLYASGPGDRPGLRPAL